MAKRKNMNIQFDGFGYVNNRGTSKYWGVSKDQRPGYAWRIQINTASNSNLTFSFLGVNPSEQVVAQIAAEFYGYRHSELPAQRTMTVETTKGTFEIDTKTRYIKQISTKSKQPVMQNQLDFDVSKSGFNDDEQKLISSVVNSYMNNSLSKEGVQLLNHLTGIMIK